MRRTLITNRARAMRKAMTEPEAEAFDRLKAELDLAFSQPDDSYRIFYVEAVIARNRRPGGQR